MKGLFAVVLFAIAAVMFAQSDAVDVRPIAGDPSGSPRTGAQLEQETDRVAALLRCPVCQGVSINDSPAEMAVNMKRQVREMVAAGYDEEQILGYFERSYGEFVRLEPRREGLDLVVWLAPLVVLVAGAAVVFTIWKRRSRQTEPIPVVASDPDLEPWLRRVREIAYGGDTLQS